MKYIFDLDDVILETSDKLKPLIFKSMAKAGLEEDGVRKYYERPDIRGREFSLLGFITRLFSENHITDPNPEELYEEIIIQCPNFLNRELVEQIKKLGRENCYIVTNGEDKFQKDKIRYSGIEHLFKKIYVVTDKKGPSIQAICEENAGEEVTFVDDKNRFIKELEELNIPNLECIQYKQGETFAQLMEKRRDFKGSEMRKIR